MIDLIAYHEWDTPYDERYERLLGEYLTCDSPYDDADTGPHFLIPRELLSPIASYVYGHAVGFAREVARLREEIAVLRVRVGTDADAPAPTEEDK